MMLKSNFDEWPVPGEIFRVSALELAVLDTPHPYELSESTSAASNWKEESARNPALFNGRMMLQRAVSIEQGAIRGEAHLIDYATFLWWRKTRPRDAALHLFGLPVILSSDGAVIAIRMAARTANPGRVYCAAGSLDDGDLLDGRCDVDGNMRREVKEETGLDLDMAQADSGFWALHNNEVITLFRLYRFPLTAQELVAAVETHISTDPDPEIDAVLAIRSADPDLHDYPPFMPKILSWIFESQG
ncbi:8-oxo-dGTP pyrophosphatase MutT (NUDIX family) [Pararhizobium capsulatum DSM 1112]|uniref:8-oxo-dGTP pyrophosphatase MutT (NUDIX family) n=1 Tax=Pararhizobium capsulatum DSM 1112 TaxID=1121113 RepID=A0ABU0BRB8_9HYPH|nr:NUDIX hydrolase [Pararhizobium capsulatum]MDQ0320786.1 8-oxo-dGTP pyrophosphatase MutT (NUDIX family) [Pararhizobium capsulatum DSM 1112]